MIDAAYAAVRKPVGMRGAVDLPEGADESENKDGRAGAGLAMKTMLQPIGTCKVPMSALLAPKDEDS